MKMLELLKSRKRWTQGTSAQSATGRPVSPTSRRAVCWCLTGAAVRCYPNHIEHMRVLGHLRQVIKHTFCDTSIVGFNDSGLTDFPRIRAALKLANV